VRGGEELLVFRAGIWPEAASALARESRFLRSALAPAPE
jgi:hypothetical protein